MDTNPDDEKVIDPESSPDQNPTVAEPTDSLTDNDKSGSPEDNQDQVKPKPPQAIPAYRLAQQTRKYQEEKAQREALEERLRKLENPDDGPPKYENFSDDVEFQRAEIKYHAKLQAQEAVREQQELERKKEEQRKTSEAEEDFENRLTDYVTANPDAASAFTETLKFNKPLASAVVSVSGKDKEGNDLGASFFHYIHANPSEFNRLNNLDPIKVGLEVGQIVSRLSSTPTKKQQTQAPTPMSPVQGGSVNDTDDPTKAETMEEYMKMRMKQLNPV